MDRTPRRSRLRGAVSISTALIATTFLSDFGTIVATISSALALPLPVTTLLLAAAATATLVIAHEIGCADARGCTPRPSGHRHRHRRDQRGLASVTRMLDELVRLAVRSGIATITLDSPANRNALSAPLRAQLLAALEHSAADSSVRVVVLDHTGPVFCAGMDLTEPPDAVTELPPILQRIWTHPKPIVAKLSGHARAGGIGLLAAADITVAAAHATFAFTEVRIGVAPAVISVTVLPRMLCHMAHELFLTGETFDATRAAAIGLLNSAVPVEQLDAEVDRYTAMLVQGGPQALALTKQLLRRGRAPDFAAMLALSTARFASEEAQEGIRAFTEKRTPSWVPPPTPSTRHGDISG